MDFVMKNYTVTVNGVSYNVSVEEGTSAAVQSAPAPAPAPAAPAATPAPAPAASGAAGSVKIEAPMPGTILDIKVSVGAAVTSGQTLCVLEAMKMENDIVSPQDATVASINVNKGDSIDAGQVIITLI